MNPEIPSCQETRHHMSAKVMDPAFLIELSHGGINSWVASGSSFPGFQISFSISPLDLLAFIISKHLIIVGCFICGQIVKFSIEELALQRISRLHIIGDYI